MTQDLAKLLLRLVLGILVLLYGIHKVIYGINSIEHHVVQAGLPQIVAYGVYIGEFIAPILLILGLYTRPAAVIIAINVFMALFLVHKNQLIAIQSDGGLSLGYQFLLLTVAIVIALLGAGRFSLNSPYN